MTGPLVWTESRNRQDRIYLGQIAHVGPPTYGSTFPGGARMLSCSVETPHTSHRALTVGRRVGVTVGAQDVWEGTLTEPSPQPDGRVVLNAEGYGVAPARFVAVDRTYELQDYRHNALHLDAVVDDQAGVSRLGPIRRAGALPVLPDAHVYNGTIMMDEAFTRVADGLQKRWLVHPDGTVRFYPTAGTDERYLLVARDDPGRSITEYTTTMWATYIDSLTGLARLRSAVDNPALLHIDAREELVDLTGSGSRTQEQVDVELLARIRKSGPRPRFSEPFRVAPGELLTAGGVPVDLATVYAGGIATVVGADSSNGLAVDQPAFTMVEVSYDDEAKTLTVTPGGNLVDAA